MSAIVIEGGRPLQGTLPVEGSKNAALALLAASLLTREPMTYTRIPAILDVDRMLQIMKSLGVSVERHDESLTIVARSLVPDHLQRAVVVTLRGSVLLLGALLGRDAKVDLPRPGGDLIGARPLDVHLDAFRQMGATVEESARDIAIFGDGLKPSAVVLREMSVTATENVMLTAATLPGTTTIQVAACEPHVVALADLLTQMGATITGAGTHTISVTGAQGLKGARVANIPDMLEAGLFMVLGAAVGRGLTVQAVPRAHLLLLCKVLADIGVALTWLGADTVSVNANQLTAFRIKTLPYPGLPTDLQAPLTVLACQAQGTSLIHDPMYDGRYRHVLELKKMGADINLLDEHRWTVNGPTPLKGATIDSLDIRSGASLVVAGLLAAGRTTIQGAETIDRGYARLVERLQAVGADIRRVEA